MLAHVLDTFLTTRTDIASGTYITVYIALTEALEVGRNKKSKTVINNIFLFVENYIIFYVTNL